MLLAAVGLERRSRLRRAPDAIPLGPQGAAHRVAVEPDRHSVPAGDRLRGGGPALRTRAGDRRTRGTVQGRRGHVRLARRRQHERGRVLGIAERGLPDVACRCSSSSRTTATPSPSRSMFRPPAETSPGSSRRFPDSSSAASTAPTSRRATARCGRRWTTCATAADRHWCTRTSRGPYSHSLSDDERLYKTPDERAAEAMRDPIVRLGDAADVRWASPARRTSKAIARDVDREITRPPSGRSAPRSRRWTPSACTCSHRTSIRHRPRSPPSQAGGQAGHDGVGDQSHAERRNGARRAHRRVWRRCRRLQPAGCALECLGQGWRLQGHARAAARVRRRTRVQFSARRGGDHRACHGHGHAGNQAGRRDPVLRLHLAGDDADPRRDVDAAVSLQQRLLVPHRHSRGNGWLLARRRAVPQPVRREHLRALPGHQNRLSVERAGRGRPAPDFDPVRRSGHLPGAQAPLSTDV